MPGRVKVDLTRCTRCGTCVLICSESVLIQENAGAVPVSADGERCVSCGHCAAICPTGAFQHEDFPEGSIRPVSRDLVPSFDQVMEMLRARRSLRLFTEAPVEREAIEKVLDAARLAPSAHNFQLTEYIVIQDTQLLGRLSQSLGEVYRHISRQLGNPVTRALYRLKLGKPEYESVALFSKEFKIVAKAAGRGEDPFLRDAPCVIVAHARRSLNFPETNAALALHNAALAAQALGLGGFMVGYLVGAAKMDRRIREMLGLPRDHDVYSALALGYPRYTYGKWIERRPLTVRWV